LTKRIDGCVRIVSGEVLRGFANFGTYSECVKVYQSLGFAKRKAKKIGGQVVGIPFGIYVGADGGIYDENLGKNGEIRAYLIPF
jgi:hypothetical protein